MQICLSFIPFIRLSFLLELAPKIFFHFLQTLPAFCFLFESPSIFTLFLSSPPSLPFLSSRRISLSLSLSLFENLSRRFERFLTFLRLTISLSLNTDIYIYVIVKKMESQYTDVQYVSIFTEISLSHTHTHTHSSKKKSFQNPKSSPFQILLENLGTRGVEEERENAIESILEILFIDPDRIIITLLL